MDELLEKVKELHIKNNFKENGGEDKRFRMLLLMEELGEICSAITKEKGSFEEEHADLLILLLGNCVAYDIDIIELTRKKLDKIMNAELKSIDGYSRLVTSGDGS